MRNGYSRLPGENAPLNGASAGAGAGGVGSGIVAGLVVLAVVLGALVVTFGVLWGNARDGGKGQFVQTKNGCLYGFKEVTEIQSKTLEYLEKVNISF